MNIVLACDHAGVELKEEIRKHIEAKENVQCVDVGIAPGESADYPLQAAKGCEKITSGECELGIFCCGTGIGISIAANKIRGIRAACCSDCFGAKYTRLHNDANVLCLGGRVVGTGLALELVDAFLGAEFEGGRHQRRVDLIASLEKN